jgi:zinc D-Ala-D-Ala carboxypeptidase
MAELQLTDHFTYEELGVAGCDEQLVENARWLCEQILEPIRTKFGPVRVHDGYRDPAHNARVGGKADSFHLFEWGRAAADIDAQYVAVQDLFDWLRLESRLPFDKVIMESNARGTPSTVHIQVDRLKIPRRQAFTGHTGDGKTYLPQQVA